MNKGQWVIVGFVGLALATSVAYISIQMNASPPTQRAAPPAEAAPASPAAPAVDKEAAPPAAAPAPTTAISQDQARTIAIGVLKGDPYGQTDAEVRANISSESLVEENGRKDWVFAIRVAPTQHVPEGITGEMRVNATSGEWEPRGLPFLD